MLRCFFRLKHSLKTVGAEKPLFSRGACEMIAAESRGMLSPGYRLFLMAGILGGFTTFSAFALETLALAQDGSWSRAAVNILAQLVLGIGAAVLGYALGRGW